MCPSASVRCSERSGFRRAVSFRASDLSGEAPFPGVPPQMLAHTSICDPAPNSKQMKGTEMRRRFDSKPPPPPPSPRFRAFLPGRRHPFLTKTGTVSSVHLSICLAAALCQRATTAVANYANGCSECGDSLVRGASTFRRFEAPSRYHREPRAVSRQRRRRPLRRARRAIKEQQKSGKTRFSVPTTFPLF